MNGDCVIRIFAFAAFNAIKIHSQNDFAVSSPCLVVSFHMQLRGKVYRYGYRRAAAESQRVWLAPRKASAPRSKSDSTVYDTCRCARGLLHKKLLRHGQKAIPP
jgi:hypothetical protein